jgi:hydrogenase nickel incorporation protein HypA/HybF
MHEVAIMEEAVKMAVDAARSAGGKRVLRLQLRVGRFSGVVPEAMRFAFEIVCHETIAAGATLEIESVPAACWCPMCRVEFDCSDLVCMCPVCRGVSSDLRRGRELEIAAVDVEYDSVAGDVSGP